jgi:hypothetical protein
MLLLDPEDGGDIFFYMVQPVFELQGVTTQKIMPFKVIVVGTSYPT